MNSVPLALVIIGVLSTCIFAEDRCNHPPPAENYANSLYQGRWYEIGKVIYIFFNLLKQNSNKKSKKYLPNKRMKEMRIL